MKFENTDVFNFENAFRGMRNPYDSWEKSDSSFGVFSYEPDDDGYDIAEAYFGNPNWRNSDDPEEIKEAEEEIDELQDWLVQQGIRYHKSSDCGTYTYIGPKDMDLAQRLIKGGAVHRKFLRQILVSVDITAPFYWWKEFDTYKVGTTANSCSTMHKLASYPIEVENFELGDFCPNLVFWTNDNGDSPVDYEVKDEIEDFIFFLEKLRQKYVETKDKRYWKELVRWLPEGWLQKRTVTMNYENLRNIYEWRKDHRLTEWHEFCKWVDELPYAEDLITYGLTRSNDDTN